MLKLIIRNNLPKKDIILHFKHRIYNKKHKYSTEIFILCSMYQSFLLYVLDTYVY